MNRFFKTIKAFLTEFLPKQKCLSQNSIISYKFSLNLLIKYMTTIEKIQLKNIDFAHFNQSVISNFIIWLTNNRHCSSSTCNQRLSAVRSFFKYAATFDCSHHSLALDITNVPIKKTGQKLVDFLTEEELNILFKQPDTATKVGQRNLFFMILMYDTAARCSELLDLKVNCFKFNVKEPLLYLSGKGNKSRPVPLLNRTFEHYRHYIKNFHDNNFNDNINYLFFTVRNGIKNKMSPDNVAAFFKMYGNSAKKVLNNFPNNFHPHMLRHTRAMHLYRNGMPLPLLSEFLGHTSVATTQIYAYADTEMKRKAIEKAELQRSNNSEPAVPIWEDDEDLILKLSGLV
jgi:site-specific recombinase XerD